MTTTLRAHDMEDAITRISSAIEEVNRIIMRTAIKGGCTAETRTKAAFLLMDAARQIETKLPLFEGE